MKMLQSPEAKGEDGGGEIHHPSCGVGLLGYVSNVCATPPREYKRSLTGSMSGSGLISGRCQDLFRWQGSAGNLVSRSHQTDQMSRLRFAQIARLKAHEFGAADMARPLKRDQHLLNFVQLDIVASKAREMMCQQVAFRADIGHVVPLGHLPN